MARERWPKARRSSGANQRALRSVSAPFLFFSVMVTPVRDFSSGHLTGDPSGASPFLTMAARHGAVSSLQKPFKPAEPLAAVAGCLEAAKSPSSSSVTAGDIAHRP
jgi:hypothetical protein